MNLVISQSHKRDRQQTGQKNYTTFDGEESLGLKSILIQVDGVTVVCTLTTRLISASVSIIFEDKMSVSRNTRFIQINCHFFIALSNISPSYIVIFM